MKNSKIKNDDSIIEIRASDHNNNVKIEFENSGPQIPKNNLETIFDPLFTSKPYSVDLGLAVCKEIVEKCL
ncbi:MAG: sensor histidine kinase [Thaumarchaeota archaeon]|nr:sensor histidine kinase [Nitrososphaerota archaeon]